MRRFTLTVAAVASLLSAAGCEPQEPQEPDAWSVVHKGLPAALLSVWGSSADDIWTVGGDVGSGPLVMHYDGKQWQQPATGSQGTLWWVAGHGDIVWMVGDGGTIVRYERTADRFTKTTAPTQERLYGVLPLADNDIWAVGGNDSNIGVIWHNDGTGWRAPADLPPGLTDGLAFFKVWGERSDDLWIVGEGGAALHRTSTGWERLEVPLGRKLFTVHGRGDTVLGVGGFVSALVVELAADGILNVTPEGEVMQLNGVHVAADLAVAVGLGGSIWRRQTSGTWAQDLDAPTVPLEYHGTFIDPSGGIWAVGGRLGSDPPTDGVVTHFGQPLATTTP